MKKLKLYSLAFAALLSFGSLTASAQSLSPTTKWHWNKGKIVIETPERPAGQKDVLGLALPKKKAQAALDKGVAKAVAAAEKAIK